MERQLRKTKEKAIGKGKWQGRGGPKGAYRVSEMLPADYDADIELPKNRKVRKSSRLYPGKVAAKPWRGRAQTLKRSSLEPEDIVPQPWKGGAERLERSC